MGKRKFVAVGPYRWKQARELPNRLYVRGIAKIQANAIATISDPQARIRACARMYNALVEYDPKLNREWFQRACNVTPNVTPPEKP